MRRAFFSIYNVRIVCDTQNLSFKMFNVRDMHSYYIALCILQYLLHIVHIFTIKFFLGRYEKNRNVILIITEKCQLLQRKILSSNLHCLKVKPSFHQMLFQKEKTKWLLRIYARRLSDHLWFNGQQKSLVTDLNWNPW